jgi:hypothetical protein
MAEITAMRNNALPYPMYGLAWTITFPFLDADGDLVTAATTPDAERSLNGDTFADCTNESTEIATGSGVYYLTLTAAEMTADIVTVIAKSATAGMKTTVATLYPRKLVQFKASATSAAGAAGTITFDAGASTIDDFYNGMVIVATLDGAVETRIITDYVGSTKVASVTPNWNTTPDSDDTFIVYLTPEMSHYVRADVLAIAGAAVSTSAAQLGVNVVNAGGTAWASGAITAAVIATGAIDADAIADNAIDAGAIAADAITAAKIADGAIDAATFAANAITSTVIANDAITDAKVAADVTIASVTGAVGSVTGNVGGNVTGTIGGLTAAALKDFFDTDSATTYASAVAGSVVKEIADNAGGSALTEAGIAAAVWDLDATSHQTQGTFGQAIGDPAADTDTIYALANSIKSDTAAILADTGTDGVIVASIANNAITAAAIATGAIDADAIADNAIDAGAIAADAITAAKIADGAIDAATFAAGAITATVIATDAIDNDAIAANAVTEIQNGLATAASITALNNLSAAQVNAEVVDALATDTYAEPGQGAPSATTTLAAKINYLYKAWRNKTTQTSSQYSLYADDASTIDQKATVSDDATTMTRGEVATGP